MTEKCTCSDWSDSTERSQCPAHQNDTGEMTKRQLPTLQCYPCKHKGICCKYGSSVEDDEAKAIRERFGESALVWDEEEKGFRTSVMDGMCFFHNREDGTCKIHSESFYPKVCQLFPYEAIEGGPYQYDLDICPDLVGY